MKTYDKGLWNTVWYCNKCNTEILYGNYVDSMCPSCGSIDKDNLIQRSKRWMYQEPDNLWRRLKELLNIGVKGYWEYK